MIQVVVLEKICILNDLIYKSWKDQHTWQSDNWFW